MTHWPFLLWENTLNVFLGHKFAHLSNFYGLKVNTSLKENNYFVAPYISTNYRSRGLDFLKLSSLKTERNQQSRFPLLFEPLKE